MNAERIDPTRTVTLRRKFNSYHGSAWRRIAMRAKAIASEAERFDAASDRIAYFNRRLRQLIDDEMRQAENDYRYGVEALLIAAYLRGLRAADADAERAGYATTGEAQDVIHDRDHREELAALLLILLADFRGMVENAVSRLQSVYAQAIRRSEDGAAVVADIARKVASVNVPGFVSTAVVGVFAGAMLARFQQLGVQRVGVDAEMHWETAGDGRVCSRCLEFSTRDNGFGPGIYTIQQARGLIPVHRLCRCRWRIARAR